MAVLVLRGLDEADRRKAAVLGGLVEPAEVVLVVGLSVVTDLGQRGRCHVVRVRRRLEVLERVVVRAVVHNRGAGEVGVRRCAHGVRRVVARRCGRREATLEPTPRDAAGVEFVADVLTRHGAEVVGRGVVLVRAVVVGGIGVVGDRADTGGGRPGDHVGVGGGLQRGRIDGGHAVGLPGDQVQRSRRRRTVRRAVGVVGHRVVLRVVPQRSHGVPVVVPHRQAWCTEEPGALVDAGVLHELIVGAAVGGLLLRQVAVVLVARCCLVGAQPERRVEVGVAGDLPGACSVLMLRGVRGEAVKVVPSVLAACG